MGLIHDGSGAKFYVINMESALDNRLGEEEFKGDDTSGYNQCPPSPASSSSSDGADICRDFLRNVCKRGARCKFRHPSSDDCDQPNPKWIRCEPTFCHDYQNMGCYRATCRFVHCSREDEELCKQVGKVPVSLLIAAANGHISSLVGQPNAGPMYPDLQPETNAPGFVPVCKDFLKGCCKRGGKCKFRHVTQGELEHQKHQQQQQQQQQQHAQAQQQHHVHQLNPTYVSGPDPSMASCPVQQPQPGLMGPTITLYTHTGPPGGPVPQATVQLDPNSGQGPQQPPPGSKAPLTEQQMVVQLPVQLQQQVHVTQTPGQQAYPHQMQQPPPGNSCINGQMYSTSGQAYFTTGPNDQQTTIIPLSSAPPHMPPVTIGMAVVPLVSTSGAPTISLLPTLSSSNMMVAHASDGTSRTSTGHNTSTSATCSMIITVPDISAVSCPQTIQSIPVSSGIETLCEPRQNAKRPRFAGTLHQTQQPTTLLWTSNDTTGMGGLEQGGTLITRGGQPRQQGGQAVPNQPPPDYHMLADENAHLRRNLDDLRRQNNDLHAANEVLLEQNARLRNTKHQSIAAHLYPTGVSSDPHLAQSAMVSASHVIVTPTLTSVASAVNALAPIHPPPSLLTPALLTHRPLSGALPAISIYDPMNSLSGGTTVMNGSLMATADIPVCSLGQTIAHSMPSASQTIAMGAPQQQPRPFALSSQSMNINLA